MATSAHEEQQAALVSAGEQLRGVQPALAQLCPRAHPPPSGRSGSGLSLTGRRTQPQVSGCTREALSVCARLFAVSTPGCHYSQISCHLSREAAPGMDRRTWRRSASAETRSRAGEAAPCRQIMPSRHNADSLLVLAGISSTDRTRKTPLAGPRTSHKLGSALTHPARCWWRCWCCLAPAVSAAASPLLAAGTLARRL